MRENAAPPALEEIQVWFASHLTRTFRKTQELNLPVYSPSVIEEIRERIAPRPHLSPEECFGIYNQQYWWRLFVLLQESFPTLVRLFGYRDFNTLIAEPYLLRYPPNHWFLPRLGKDLVQWIREDYREDDRQLILQIGEVDAAHEALFHAGTKPLPSVKEWTQKLYLQPTIALFHHVADFFAFRSELLEHGVAYWQTEDLPELDHSKQNYYSILYCRKAGLVHEKLEPAQYQLLSAFKSGSFINEANRDWFDAWIERGFFTAEEISDPIPNCF
jgi:hypothetical protein